MRKFALALCVLALPVLSSCITAYRGNKSQIASCEVYDKAFRKPIQEQLGPGQHLQELNKTAAMRYNDAVAENSTALLKPIVIRYSEAGNVASQCDVALALQAVRDVKKDKIVLVFVHGWRNDSGPGSNIVYNYQDAPIVKGVMGDDLSTFAALATSVSRRSKRPVIPIFVSWKGGPGFGALDVVSFWNRRDAADRIARTGELNRLFGAIENISDDQERAKIDNQVIYIGHSFGSRILFSSVVSEMISRAQLASPEANDGDGSQHEKIKPPADLILLFNPALEAASYRAIDEFRYSDAKFDNNALPLMLVMQSESDKAVGVYFPAGQFFWGFLNATRITGLGFKPEYRTHVMCTKKPGVTGCGQYPADDRFLCPDLCPEEPYTFAPAARRGLDVDGDGLPDAEPHGSPFDVVVVDEEILDGHVWFNGGGGFETLFSNDKQDGGRFNEWLARLLARVSAVREKESATLTPAAN